MIKTFAYRQPDGAIYFFVKDLPDFPDTIDIPGFPNLAWNEKTQRIVEVPSYDTYHRIAIETVEEYLHLWVLESQIDYFVEAIASSESIKNEILERLSLHQKIEFFSYDEL